VGAAAPARILVNDAAVQPAASRDDDRRDADALLEIAIEAATMAGALLLERAQRGAEREVSSKSTPTDLVSEADLAAERAIRELLATHRPHDGFLGEEGGHEDSSSGFNWVVDPLDGTVNFLFGIPQWCVSVAVRDSRGTVAGAVYDPNRDELFTASRDGSATLVGPAGETELVARGSSGVAGAQAGEGAVGDGELATAMVATGFAYDARVRAAQAPVLARLLPRVRDVRRLGSAALDLAWTAAGRYDAYFERTVKPWDIAAGALICERVGLHVLELPEREQLPWGILVTRAELAEPLLELVGGG
jgi:myo-inositol-1(or 4)-monophosphatase